MSLLGLILLTLPPSGEGKPPTNIHMALPARTTLQAVTRASSPWSDTGNSAIPSELFFPVLFLSISFPNSWQAGGQAGRRHCALILTDSISLLARFFSHFCNRVTIPTITIKTGLMDGRSFLTLHFFDLLYPFGNLPSFWRWFCGKYLLWYQSCTASKPAVQQASSSASQQFSKPASSSNYPSIHPLNDVA
jgi:hypothetical protein